MKRSKHPSLSDSLRAWVQDERSRTTDQPPTDRELHDYLDGKLEESRRFELEELAVFDPETSARILELQSERTRNARQPNTPTDAEKAEHWRAIRELLSDQPSSAAGAPKILSRNDEKVRVDSPNPVVPFQGRPSERMRWLAAGWAATALVLGFWILRLESRPEEGALTQASHEAGPPLLTEAPLQLELRSREMLTRSQAQDSTPRIDRSADATLLALVPDHFQALDAYRASIREEQGKSFPPRPVSRRAGGEFYLQLVASGLAAGSYEILLEGRRGDSWEVLGVYPLELTDP